jgi:hypothetical protein
MSQVLISGFSSIDESTLDMSPSGEISVVANKSVTNGPD